MAVYRDARSLCAVGGTGRWIWPSDGRYHVCLSDASVSGIKTTTTDFLNSKDEKTQQCQVKLHFGEKKREKVRKKLLIYRIIQVNVVPFWIAVLL
jgi:hypothetical protein